MDASRDRPRAIGVQQPRRRVPLLGDREFRRGLVVAAEDGEARAVEIVKTKARGIQPRRHRNRRPVLSPQSALPVRVRHREGPQQRLQRGGRNLSRAPRRHDRHGGDRLMQPQSFVRAEEERPIFDDRPAEHAAELMVSELGLLHVRRVGEPVVRVERVMTEILERGAAELVRARTAPDRDLRARRTAELGGIRGRLDAHVLQRIDGNQVARGAERGRRQQTAAGGKREGGADVGARAIDRDVVRVVTLAIRGELAIAEARCPDHARNQPDERLQVAAVQRQASHELSIDDRIHRGRRVHAHGVCLDDDGFTDRRDLERQVQHGFVVHVEHDVGHLQRRESVMLRGELIASRRKPREHELPALGRLGLALESRGGIDDHDFDASHHAAAFVDDTSGKRGSGGFRPWLASSMRQPWTREDEQCEKDEYELQRHGGRARERPLP
jgi:hypothetical protein